MSHTCYYEADLPLGDEGESSKSRRNRRKVELFVSDFFGTHEIYLRIDDDENGTMRLGKVQARALLDGLSEAMRYLSY